MNFESVRKILVIKLRHIGDVLLAVPVFRALRETFPGAEVSALVNSGTGEVLQGHPLIAEVLLFERAVKGLSPWKKYLEEIAFLRGIRHKGFDMTVDLTGGDRAAVLSFASAARYRLGWRPRKGFMGKSRLYTHLSEPNRKEHMVLQNLEVISAFGINTEDLSVDFHIPEEDKISVRNILRENNVTDRDTIVHVHPTSRWLFKCWKDDSMAEVISWLVNKGTVVVVTSSPAPKEMEKARSILSSVPPRITGHASRVIDLCGRTTIKQLGAISGSAALFFGVDSAPMHIAAAVGTPVVALFGPSGAFNWGPWDNGESTKYKVQSAKVTEGTPYSKRNGIQRFGIHTVIQRDWECIPCGSDGCGGSKISRCLEDVSVDEVRDVITARLEKMGR